MDRFKTYIWKAFIIVEHVSYIFTSNRIIRSFNYKLEYLKENDLSEIIPIVSTILKQVLLITKLIRQWKRNGNQKIGKIIFKLSMLRICNNRFHKKRTCKEIQHGFSGVLIATAYPWWSIAAISILHFSPFSHCCLLFCTSSLSVLSACFLPTPSSHRTCCFIFFYCRLFSQNDTKSPA